MSFQPLDLSREFSALQYDRATGEMRTVRRDVVCEAAPLNNLLHALAFKREARNLTSMVFEVDATKSAESAVREVIANESGRYLFFRSEKNYVAAIPGPWIIELVSLARQHGIQPDSALHALIYQSNSIRSQI